MEALGPYTESFYRDETSVARESAEIVVPWVLAELGNPLFVIDIGSGTGAWAAVAAEAGCIVRAVDMGVPEHLQQVPVIDLDISEGYPCHDWDLAICLEVAEHLPAASGPLLVDGLAQATSVLFSAATPGQPGVNHVNCRPHDYWHLLFERHGLYPTHIGPQFGEPVASFYQRNLHLYRRMA